MGSAAVNAGATGGSTAGEIDRSCLGGPAPVDPVCKYLCRGGAGAEVRPVFRCRVIFRIIAADYD